MSAEKARVEQDIQQKLELLRQGFISKLPSRMDTMSTSLEEFRATANTDALREFYRLVHSLAGAGATYGFAQLSTVSRTLEVELKKLVAQEQPLPEDFSPIEPLFTALKESICAVAQAAQASDTVVSSSSHAVKNAVVLKARILIIDDDADIRASLRVMLESYGHQVVEAESGEQGLASFCQFEPSIVLLDVVMPGMNGYEVARKLKADTRGGYTPIIFITALNDDSQLAKCVEVGGDDFVTKPFNTVLVQARIQAMQRIYELNRELQLYKEQNVEEHNQARHVFDAVFDHVNEALPQIDSWLQSATDFSGDCQLLRRSPMGGVYVFLADFTGHGLAPAVGTVLVAETFYELVTLNAGGDIILETINQKINSILPTGRYCAAALLVCHPEQDHIEVWNYGLPDILLLDQSARTISSLSSNGLPLGVLPKVDSSADVRRIKKANVAALVAYTDGITEAYNENECMFGDERLQQAIAQAGDCRKVLENVSAAVAEFMGKTLCHDDISMVVLNIEFND